MKKLTVIAYFVALAAIPSLLCAGTQNVSVSGRSHGTPSMAVEASNLQGVGIPQTNIPSFNTLGNTQSLLPVTPDNLGPAMPSPSILAPTLREVGTPEQISSPNPSSSDQLALDSRKPPIGQVPNKTSALVHGIYQRTLGLFSRSASPAKLEWGGRKFFDGGDAQDSSAQATAIRPHYKVYSPRPRLLASSFAKVSAKAAAVAAGLTLSLPNIALAGEGSSSYAPVLFSLGVGAITFSLFVLLFNLIILDPFTPLSRVKKRCVLYTILGLSGIGMLWMSDRLPAPTHISAPSLNSAIHAAQGKAQDPSVRDWISQLLGPDKEVRERALKALSDTEQDASVAVAAVSASLIDDPNPQVRIWAAYALARLGTREDIYTEDNYTLALETLARSATQDRDPIVRRSSLSSLADLAKKGSNTMDKALSVLGQILKEDVDAKVRGSAAFNIGLLGSEAIPLRANLQRALASDLDLHVRAQSGVTLLKINQADDILIRRVLDDLIRDMETGGVISRINSVSELGGIAKYAREQDITEKALASLSRAILQDSDRHVRNSAVDSLRYIGLSWGQPPVSALPVLRQALVREPDPEIRDNIRTAIERIERHALGSKVLPERPNTR